MKKQIIAIVALALLAVALCAGLAEAQPLNVVATIFPAYDWAREIAGDDGDVSLTLLLEALGDGAKAEETVEGMEAEDEEEEAGEIEYDEHVWLSLRNAKALTTALAAALGEAAPEKAAAFTANAEAYAAKLDALDAAYAEAVDAAGVRTILFGDRFPFRYLADDYGLDYYAAFSGCSAESEASFETIVFLAGKVDALALPAVLTIEGADHRIAETVVQATQAKDAAILTLDSLQSATAADVEGGATYLDAMADNLEVLKQALNR